MLRRSGRLTAAGLAIAASTATAPSTTEPAAATNATRPTQIAAGPAGTSSITTPDVYRTQEWTLGALHITRTWKYTKGNGVIVAVLDTGVDGRQDDLSGRVIDGPDYTGNVRLPGNKYWGRHGTAMASIIAGHGHGPAGSEGIIGVAPEARILSIRVTLEDKDPNRNSKAQLDRDRDAIANGIRYAVDHGAQIINMSLGGGKQFYDGNPLEEGAIGYALSKGVVLIASAGNDGNGANQRNYPAAYPGVIAVGSVDRDFMPSDFTNRHDYVAVAAPGRSIVSADTSGHPYVTGTGTSVSSAFVAGIAVLLKAHYPRLSPQEIRQALQRGCTHRPATGHSDEIGAGTVDAYGAYRAATTINAADHDGFASTTPTPAAAITPSAHHRPDLMLIAILSGGGTLILLSLVMGWRERRRAIAAAGTIAAPTVHPPNRQPSPVLNGHNGHTSHNGRSARPPTPETAPVDVAPWQSFEAFSGPRPEASNGNGGGNPLIDPLTIKEIPLEPDVGTPLADESWRRIRRYPDQEGEKGQDGG